jgi:fructose 1,6-bisphosphate aldolase/phosphatase
MRRQGFFGAAMLPMAELEYTGIMEKLTMLDGRFTVRSGERTRDYREERAA